MKFELQQKLVWDRFIFIFILQIK